MGPTGGPEGLGPHPLLPPSFCWGQTATPVSFVHTLLELILCSESFELEKLQCRLGAWRSTWRGTLHPGRPQGQGDPSGYLFAHLKFYFHINRLKRSD